MPTLCASLAASRPESHYVPFCSRLVNGQVAAAWWSPELEDPHWDDFLAANPLGHFQQSSLWARAKSIEGWRPVRGILTLEGRIAGGFQILTRRTRFGLIGYVSKGPVVIQKEDGLLDFMMELVVSTAKANHLKALIVQSPDRGAIDDAIWKRHRFLPNHLVNVISATAMVDLRGETGEVSGRFRKSTLKKIRRAERRGITMRQGDKKDIGTFYRLMLKTCERQQTHPSPSTESALQEIWDAFNPRGGILLFFAQHEGESIAALLCLGFGERITLWKKGWSGKYPDKHPNEFLIYEAIEWSRQRSYKKADFVGLDREIAIALLGGRPLSESQMETRDFFTLGFGAEPVVLPESKIYISNPGFRFLYRYAMTCTWGRALAKRLVAGRIG